ncbi:MAG: hypothetical protein WA874_17915 [Chryseosolibacter sp.]
MIRRTTSVPFDFVLDKLEPCSPVVKPMFGCHAVYVGEKIVLILRRKENHHHDNGVWLATTHEHHATLQSIFPSMRSIRLFGGRSSSWQNLPADADDFEESVITACEMILKNDARIGKITRAKKKKAVRKR